MCCGFSATGFDATCALLTALGDCNQMVITLFAGYGTTTLPSGLSPTAYVTDVCPVSCGTAVPRFAAQLRNTETSGALLHFLSVYSGFV